MPLSVGMPQSLGAYQRGYPKGLGYPYPDIRVNNVRKKYDCAGESFELVSPERV